MGKIKPVLAVTAVATVALAVVGLAVGGGATKLTATLDTKSEVPAVTGVAGTGKFTGTLRGNKLSWSLTFSGLSGPALAAHVHLGKPGQAGPVAIPLCGPCTSGAKGTAKANAQALKAIRAGAAYVNVHTQANQGGEIRGQIAGGKAASGGGRGAY